MLRNKLSHKFQAVERNISSFPIKSPSLPSPPSLVQDIYSNSWLYYQQGKIKHTWKLSKPVCKWHLKSILRSWLLCDIRTENCIHLGKFFSLCFLGINSLNIQRSWTVQQRSWISAEHHVCILHHLQLASCIHGLQWQFICVQILPLS